MSPNRPIQKQTTNPSQDDRNYAISWGLRWTAVPSPTTCRTTWWVIFVHKIEKYNATLCTFFSPFVVCCACSKDEPFVGCGVQSWRQVPARDGNPSSRSTRIHEVDSEECDSSDWPMLSRNSSLSGVSLQHQTSYFLCLCRPVALASVAIGLDCSIPNSSAVLWWRVRCGSLKDIRHISRCDGH